MLGRATAFSPSTDTSLVHFTFSKKLTMVMKKTINQHGAFLIISTLDKIKSSQAQCLGAPLQEGLKLTDGNAGLEVQTGGVQTDSSLHDLTLAQLARLPVDRLACHPQPRVTTPHPQMDLLPVI